MPKTAAPVLLNDVHARLNRTRVAELVMPRSVAQIVARYRARLAADPEERFQSEWYRHWRDHLG